MNSWKTMASRSCQHHFMDTGKIWFYLCGEDGISISIHFGTMATSSSSQRTHCGSWCRAKAWQSKVSFVSVESGRLRSLCSPFAQGTKMHFNNGIEIDVASSWVLNTNDRFLNLYWLLLAESTSSRKYREWRQWAICWPTMIRSRPAATGLRPWCCRATTRFYFWNEGQQWARSGRLSIIIRTGGFTPVSGRIITWIFRGFYDRWILVADVRQFCTNWRLRPVPDRQGTNASSSALDDESCLRSISKPASSAAVPSSWSPVSKTQGLWNVSWIICKTAANRHDPRLIRSAHHYHTPNWIDLDDNYSTARTQCWMSHRAATLVPIDDEFLTNTLSLP